MRLRYRRWRADAIEILDGVDRSLHDFKNNTASIVSSTHLLLRNCSAFAASASEVLGPPHGVLTVYNLCRLIARELTYRGFDYELALTDKTVFKLIGLEKLTSTMKSAIASPDVVKVESIIFLNGSTPCGPGGSEIFPWGYDRIGLHLKIFTASSDVFNLLISFGVSVSGSVLSLQE